MELSPYITGAITAIVYFATSHLLPKKLKGFLRALIAIVAAAAVCCLIHFVYDCITEC